MAGRRIFEQSGLPGPGVGGFGARVGQCRCGRRFRNPRRTRAGVSRPGSAGFSHGRRKSAAASRRRRIWVWAAMISQVQRSPALGFAASGGSTRGSVSSAGRCAPGRSASGMPASARRRPRSSGRWRTTTARAGSRIGPPGSVTLARTLPGTGVRQQTHLHGLRLDRCTLVGARDQTKAAPAARECPAGLPSSIRRSKSVRQRHGEIHLDELSRKAQLGDAQERAGGGERRTQGRLGEPTPCGSENVPLIAPHVDH